MTGYTLRDPRPVVRENPYTFFVPSPEELAQVIPGQLVKLIFAADPPREKYGAERMWVIVTARDGNRLTGALDNDPDDIPGLTSGDAVHFDAHHIIATIWDDPDQAARFAVFAADQDRFFERCLADDAVIDGRARVQFLYRETPEHDTDDQFPDSGWRIRADVAALSDEEYKNPSCSYVAIGMVLNQDDTILDLIDAPVGSAFTLENDGQFHPTDFPETNA